MAIEILDFPIQNGDFQYPVTAFVVNLVVAKFK